MKPKKRTRLLWLLLLCVLLGLFSVTVSAEDDELTRSEMLQYSRSVTATMGKSDCVTFSSYTSPSWLCNQYYTSGIHGYGHYFTCEVISYHYIDGELSYCIEPNTTSFANQTYSGYESSNAPSDSYWMEELDDTQRKYIQYILAFGYPDVDYGYSEQVQYAATQVLIWEVIMKARYADIYTTTETGLYTKVAAVLGEDFESAYKEIVQFISIYDGVFPSFTSETKSNAPTVKLTLNTSTNCYEGTVTDTNGVLSKYGILISQGATIKRDGNQLTISVPASSAAKVKGKTFTLFSTMKDMSTSDPIIWENSNYQTVLTAGGANNAKAYFKLDWEDTGSLTLIKSSTNPDMVKNNSCYSLEGTTYGLYSDYGCTNKVGTFTVNADGTSNTITDLTAGTYYYKELTAGKGYQLDSTVRSVTVVAEKTTPIYASDVPDGDPLVIILEKTNADGTGSTTDTPLSLAGAKFSITYYSGMYTSEATAEAAANAGTVQKRTWYITTKAYTYNGVTKYLASLDSGTPEGDPLFYDEGGNIVVPMGTVVVKEVSPPTGYVNSADFYFKSNPNTALGSAVILQFDGSGSAKDLVTGNYMDDLNISIYEGQIKGGVSVQKVDSSTGTTTQGNGSLAGAVFGVYSNSSYALYLSGKEYNKGDLVTTITTNSSGYAATGSQALPYGDYYLQEITAPTGYQLSSEKKTFSISTDGVVVSLGNYGDSIKQGYIQVQKQAVNTVTGEKLPENGATYQVWLKSAGSYSSAKSTERDTITIGASGVGTSKALPYGTYCLVQTAGWTGYDPNTTVYQVNITDHGSTVTVDTSGNKLSYENNIWVGSIQLLKVDGDTQQPLAGAEFTLTGTNGTTVVLTTDETGTVTFPNLYYGVTYTWTETKAPKGYLLNQENTGTWAVGKQGDRLEITCENYRRPGSISITKETAGNTPLAGVTFLLEYLDGTEWKPVTVRGADTPVTLGSTTSPVVDGCLTTGADGKVTFSGLWADDNLQYRLTEVSVPEGYALLGTTVFEGVLPVGCNAQDTSETPDEILDETLYFYDLPIIVRNSKVYALPLTGGSGFSFATVGLLVLAMGSLLLGAGTKQYIVKKENNR